MSDGRILKEWLPDVAAINAHSRFQSAIVNLYRDKSVDRMRPMHPMLLANGDLLIHDNTPLSRIDGCGRPRWVIDGIFHHSLERAADGTLWIPYRLTRSNVPGVGAKFADEALAQVDEKGRLIRVERLIEILDRNDLGGLWRGRPYEEDPFHLNDIEPVLTSGPYWQRGDVILSLRNMVNWLARAKSHPARNATSSSIVFGSVDRLTEEPAAGMFTASFPAPIANG